MASATDQLNRPLGVLRLSLTARCNLACPYCLPDGVEPPGLLTLEQRLQVIGAAVSLGARSLRLIAAARLAWQMPPLANGPWRRCWQHWGTPAPPALIRAAGRSSSTP